MPATFDVFALLDRSGDDDDAHTEPDVTIGPIGVAFPAGRAHGRFAHLDPAVEEHLHHMAELDRRAYGEHLLCEIDYVNNRDRVNHVAAAPATHEHRLAVTTGRFDGDDGHIRFADVLVGVSGGEFHLRHAPDGRRLLVRRSNLVTPEACTDVVRFLEEVTSSGFARPAWTWGELEDTLDFLPGVAVEGVLVAPPRWRVPADPADPRLARWRRDNGVPDHVYAGQMDNRLLLDLDDPAHRDLLRREVAGGVRYVTEARAPHRRGHAVDVHGDRYCTEVVVSGAVRDPDRLPAVHPAPPYDVTLGAERSSAPGDGWWYLRIRVEPDDQNALLDLLAGAAELPAGGWFHVRYRDPFDELRVRVRSAGVDLPGLCGLLRRCVAEGRATSFTIDTYVREIERYGGPVAMTADQPVFCAESAFVAGRVDLCPDPARPDGLRDVAALLGAHVRGLGLGKREIRDLFEFAVAAYRQEFGERSAALRREVVTISRRDVTEQARTAVPELEGLLAGPGAALRAALVGHERDRRTGVWQSMVHLFANRLGLDRAREYQAVFLLLTQLRTAEHRAATS